MGATDRLEFSRRVPRRARDVDARRLLKVQSHPTRLNLDQKYWGVVGPTRSPLEPGDPLIALFLADGPIYPKDWNFQPGEHILNVIHFTHELSEDQRLLFRVFQDFQNEGHHLLRPTDPRDRVRVLLERDAVEVQLRPRHDLASSKQALEYLHLVQILSLGLDDMSDNVLAVGEYFPVQLLLLRVHFELDVLKIARGQFQARIETRHALLGPPENVRISDLIRVALDHVPRDSHKRTQGDEILDRIEDGRARHDPPDRRAERIARDVHLALFVPNFVAFVQDDAIPLNREKLTDRPADALWQHRVRGDHNGRELRGQLPTSAVKCIGREVRCEPRHLLTPLPDDGLGYDHERSRLWVRNHGRDELDRLAETHLIAEKASREALGDLTLDEPLDAFALVRGYEPRAQETAHRVFDLISSRVSNS